MRQWIADTGKKPSGPLFIVSDKANKNYRSGVHAAGIEEVLGLISRAYRLSNRERELVALIARGHDTNAVAKQMFISPYTVQDHLKSIFDKLGVHSRLELLTRLFAQAG